MDLFRSPLALNHLYPNILRVTPFSIISIYFLPQDDIYQMQKMVLFTYIFNCLCIRKHCLLSDKGCVANSHYLYVMSKIAPLMRHQAMRAHRHIRALI